jgi:hypothetical protein
MNDNCQYKDNHFHKTMQNAEKYYLFIKKLKNATYFLETTH